MQAQLLIPTRHELAEGPVWHDGALWWVDINAGLLLRLDPRDHSLHARPTGDFLGAAAPTSRPDVWLLARRDHLALLDWHTGAIESWPPLDVPCDDHRFNDGKCDPAGRFLAGTLNLRSTGRPCALYSFSSHAAPQLLDADVLLSNGLAWTAAGTRFHHIDTLRRTLATRTYDPASGRVGAALNRFQFPDSWGWPDGMAADREGSLWVAFWGGGCVRRIDPDTGHETFRIDLPVTQPSSVCFGGRHLDRLFITTAWQGLSPAGREAQPLAGALFVAEPGISGLPVPVFQLPNP